VRSSAVESIVKSEPRLLFYQGSFIESALHAERVTREEVYAAVRSQGIPMLETDGTFSVLQSSETDATALKYVKCEPD
jgi:uncharacterized membrane protein YcaP (DUF421 family)